MKTKKTLPTKAILYGVLLSSLAFTLQGCGDDNGSSDSGEVATSTTSADTEPNTTSSPSQSTRDPNLKEPNPADNCVINNVVLDPPSGATLNINDGDTLKVTIDYTIKNDVTERVYFYGYLVSVDNDDYGDDRNSQFTGSGKAGRYINHFTMTFDGSYYYGNETDRYTTLRIGHWPDSGCGVDYPVNYILIGN